MSESYDDTAQNMLPYSIVLFPAFGLLSTACVFNLSFQAIISKTDLRIDLQYFSFDSINILGIETK